MEFQILPRAIKDSSFNLQMNKDKSNRRNATLITEYIDQMLKLSQYIMVQNYSKFE